MTTRFNANSLSRFDVPGLPSGFQGKSFSDVTIPSCGIEDVDVALFKLFDEEIPFSVGSTEDMKKVPVIFAAGEKWALLKKGRSIRDRNGTLILPLITIMRSGIEQNVVEDICGRGINQQTGELVIQRRLDKSDREYQSLINRLLINHQPNLAMSQTEALLEPVGQLSSNRGLGDLSKDQLIVDGGLLVGDRQNNVYETMVIPAPQFYTATYDVVIWTQYTQHMNQILETLISSFLPQGNAWKLLTPKGYWFIATVDGNAYKAENNFSDMAAEERIIKHTFTIKVPAYILVSAAPGVPIPVKRYVSNPTVDFNIDVTSASSGEVDPFIGSDDPTLPMSTVNNRRRDQRNDAGTLLYGNQGLNSDDPAAKQIPRGFDPKQYRRVIGRDKDGKTVTKYVRIKSINASSGEMVLSADSSLGGISTFIIDD